MKDYTTKQYADNKSIPSEMDGNIYTLDDNGRPFVPSNGTASPSVNEKLILTREDMMPGILSYIDSCDIIARKINNHTVHMSGKISWSKKTANGGMSIMELPWDVVDDTDFVVSIGAEMATWGRANVDGQYISMNCSNVDTQTVRFNFTYECVAT